MIFINFNVISRPAATLGERQPDPDGRFIWNLFHEKEMGRVCLIVNETYPKEMFELWLKREMFKPMMYECIEETDPQRKAERIHNVASMWGRAKWYVDNDPLVSAQTIKLGMPTLLVGVPYVLRPEWHGTRPMKSWDAITAALDEQAVIAADRTWGEM